MASTVIAGKPSNTVGEKDAVLILRGSSVKVQWGNKFIDIVKNGKINAEYDKVLRSVDSVESIKQDGVYLIDDQIWVSINGTKIQLAGTDSKVYVSFAEKQEIESEKQRTALKNIGFYYDTLEEAQSKGIQSGIIYVLGDNKLYTIVDGQFSEYFVQKPIIEEEKVEDALQKMLYIEEYSLWVDGDEYLRCDNNQINVIKQLITENGIYSLGASQNSGYRLYIENGKSILEIDEVIERNPKYLNVNLPYTLYTKHNNVVKEASIIDDIIVCELQDENKYKKDEYIYIYTYCLFESIINNNIITINLSMPLDQDIIIKINGVDVIIPKNTRVFNYSVNTVEYDISYPKVQKVLREYKILKSEKQQITIEVPSEEREMFLQNCTYLYSSRYSYIEIQDNDLKLLDRSKEVLNKETNKKEPDNTIHSKIGNVKEKEIKELQVSEEIETEDYIRPDVGIYSDNFMGLNPLLFNTEFKVAGKKDKKTEHHKYPKYSEDIKLPEDKLLVDKKFNYIVPDMEWVKRMLDFFFPIGTIIMYNGQSEIPPGWKICDGSNGTPNLVDKFVKGGTVVQQNDPDGVVQENGWYKYQIQENNLPYHTHPQQAHVHSIPTMQGQTNDSGSLSMSLNWSDYLWELSSSSISVVTSVSGEGVSSSEGSALSSVSANTQGGTTSGGNHSHNVTINGSQTGEATSYDDNKEWPNDKITIEPPSFSLIFIMKTETFVDYVNND